MQKTIVQSVSQEKKKGIHRKAQSNQTYEPYINRTIVHEFTPCDHSKYDCIWPIDPTHNKTT